MAGGIYQALLAATAAVAASGRPGTRGLHSFPFQLNLSSSDHLITQLNS